MLSDLFWKNDRNDHQMNAFQPHDKSALSGSAGEDSVSSCFTVIRALCVQVLPLAVASDVLFILFFFANSAHRRSILQSTPRACCPSYTC